MTAIISSILSQNNPRAVMEGKTESVLFGSSQTKIVRLFDGLHSQQKVEKRVEYKAEVPERSMNTVSRNSCQSHLIGRKGVN